jgi:hypothetical protein
MRSSCILYPFKENDMVYCRSTPDEALTGSLSQPPKQVGHRYNIVLRVAAVGAGRRLAALVMRNHTNRDSPCPEASMRLTAERLAMTAGVKLCRGTGNPRLSVESRADSIAGCPCCPL